MPGRPISSGVDPRRAFSRLRVGISAHFITLHGRQKVRLLDVSQGGAKLILSEPDAVREGVLAWMNFDSFGVVAWQQDDRVGIQFDRPLPLPVLVETRRRAPSIVRAETMGDELAAQAFVAGTISPGVDR